MKFGRIFANAIARRVAYVLVAMALAWLGLGDAHARIPHSTQGGAFTACQAASVQAGRTPQCRDIGYTEPCSLYGLGSGSCGVYEQCNVSAATGTGLACWGTPGFHGYPLSQTCASQPGGTFASDIAIPTGSVGCNDGCVYQVVNNGDGTYATSFLYSNNETCEVLPTCAPPNYINYATSLCQPPEEECPANQTKNPKTKQCEEACPTGMVMDPTGACKPSTDDCPAGNVRAPSGQCLPGEGQCAAGEARRPNGTCGRDSDGDGQADEDDEDPENDPDRETASGGDSCNAPPSCSGGPIDCLQAKIQWRIDCNTRHKVNVTGGACGAMPVCVGENCKAMEYAQLLQQWKAACALEKLANADGGGEGGDNSDLIALLTGPGSINGEHGDTGGMPGGDGPFQWGEGEEHEPDTSGFGYGSSCPSPPSFTVGGRTISIDLTIMCQWVSLAGSIVLVLAGLASVRIVSGGIA